MCSSREPLEKACRICLNQSTFADGLGRERDRIRIGFYKRFFRSHYLRNHLNGDNTQLKMIQMKLNLMENYTDLGKRRSFEDTIAGMIGQKSKKLRTIHSSLFLNKKENVRLDSLSYDFLGKTDLLPMRYSLIEKYGENIKEIEDQVSSRYLKQICSPDYFRSLKELSRTRKPFEDGTGNSPQIMQHVMRGLNTNIACCHYLLSTKFAFAVAANQIFGHHAGRDTGAGLCHLNTSALSAIYLAQHGKRVCVLDSDSHYGYGTAEILRNRTDIDYVGIETEPWSDPTGVLGQRSYLTGENFTNFPVQVCTDKYLSHFRNAIAKIQMCSPDVIVWNAGVDAHFSDPCGMQVLTDNDFHIMGATVSRELVRNGMKVLLSTEGGYTTSSFRCFILLCNELDRS